MLLLAFVCGMAAQGVIDLPPVPAVDPTGIPFEFPATGKLVSLWKGGPRIPRKYFQEALPALFSRTLWLETSIPAGSTLEWIFTGDEGGFTVRITSGEVRVTQRYYDSFGLNDNRPPQARFPDRTWHESEVAYSGDLRSLTVTLDHRLALLVSLNGKEAIRQTCQVRRHQLGRSGADTVSVGRVAGRVASPPVVTSTVRVNPAGKHQSIYGFGGIVSVPAYKRLSDEGRRRWRKLLMEYNLLVHREFPNGNRLMPDLSNFDRLDEATPR